MKKKNKNWAFSFQTVGGDEITLSLEQKGLKSTAEICCNGACVELQEVLFQASYWLYAFSNGEDRYLIGLKEILYAENYASFCYCNGQSLTDQSTVDSFRAQLENPRLNESAYDKKMRRNDLIVSVVVSLELAIILSQFWTDEVVWWEKLLRVLGVLIWYWGNKLLNTVADRRERKNLLKRFFDTKE